MRALVLAAMALIWAGSAWAVDAISAAEARRAALAGEITLVDIRTPQEWQATGVPDVAHALDLHSDGFVDRLLVLYEAHPNRPMAVICATGGRSGYVTKALEQRGLSRLLDVPEGMAGSQHGPGWLARSLPVRAPVDAPVTDQE